MTERNQPAAGDDFSLATIVAIPLRHVRLLVMLPMIAAGLTLAVIFLLPRFTSRAIFTPEQAQAQSAIGGLAAQFGISVGGSGPTPAFYTSLLKTTALLERVVDTTYNPAASAGPGQRLEDLLDLAPDDPPATRKRQAVAYVLNNTETLLEGPSGMIHIYVTTPWPRVSEQIARRMLDLLNDYNVDKRQSRVSAERVFVESRLAEVRRSLVAAESEMQAFLKNNRLYDQSSELSFEATRLQRNVELHQQIYASMSQAFEQARIEEVRNTPVITVVDPPEASARRAYRWKVLLILAALFGFSLAVLAAFTIEIARGEQKNHPAEFNELATLGRTAWRRLVPARFLKRRDSAASV